MNTWLHHGAVTNTHLPGLGTGWFDWACSHTWPAWWDHFQMFVRKRTFSVQPCSSWHTAASLIGGAVSSALVLVQRLSGRSLSPSNINMALLPPHPYSSHHSTLEMTTDFKINIKNDFTHLLALSWITHLTCIRSEQEPEVNLKGFEKRLDHLRDTVWMFILKFFIGSVFTPVQLLHGAVGLFNFSFHVFFHVSFTCHQFILISVFPPSLFFCYPKPVSLLHVWSNRHEFSWRK